MGKKINKIEIEAFRGYENYTLFDFTKHDTTSDLIVLHAPNGFGKTSFFESVEWCLSSKLMRIDRNKILQESEDKDRGFTLKNKNSDREFGDVKITTDDSKIIYRQTGKSKNTKNGFKDYGYENKGKSKNEVLGDSFDITSHILTQDGMDSFLRFTNSKEKFDALSNFWNKGEETSEKYRQLEKLNLKIKKRIDSLNSKITEVRREIASVHITQEQATNVNQKLTSINEKLIDDKKIITNFNKDINTESLVQLNTNLKKIIVDIEQEVDLLKKKQSDLDSLKINFLKFKQGPQELEGLKKNIENNLKIIAKFKKLTSYEKEFDEINVKIESNEILREKLLKIENLYSKHQEVKKEINKLNTSIKDLNKLKVEFIGIRQDIEKNKSQEKDKLEKLLENKECNNINIKNIKLYLNELKTINSRKIEVKNSLVIFENGYELVNKRYQDILDEKKKIENDKLFTSMYQNENFLISKKYKNSFDELKTLFLKKNELFKKINDLNKNKEKTLELKNDLTKLVSLGHHLINGSKSTICPLCNHNHEEHDKLLKEVLENSRDILDVNQIEEQIRIEKQNYQTKVNDFNYKEDILKNIINDELLKINITYTSINEDLKNKKKELEDTNNEILLCKKRFNTVFQKLKSIKKIDLSRETMYLINKEYNLYVKNLLKEIDTFIQKENESKKLIEKLSKDKDKTNEKISEISNDIENNTLKRNELETNPSFVEYNKLYQELNILEDNVKKQIDDKLKNVKNLLLDENKKNIEISTKLSILKEELEKEELDQLTLELTNEKLKFEENKLKESLDKTNRLLITYNLSQDLKEETLLENIDICIKDIEAKNIFIKEVNVLDDITESFITDLDIEEKENEIAGLKLKLENENKFLSDVYISKGKYKSFILQTIQECFNTKTINEIYNRIDPHPTHKEVIFLPELDEKGTKLRVKTADNEGQEDDPTLYNSSGQISILSLSIFLAKALQTKDELDTIFMDDPIQYLDSINVLSFIDLLRTIITKEKRQIVISTHDKNFYQLLQKKLDNQYYNSKFIELESYGKIKED